MEKAKIGKPQQWTPQYLEDDDKWMKDYFDKNDNSARYSRRKYFVGPLSL